MLFLTKKDRLKMKANNKIYKNIEKEAPKKLFMGESFKLIGCNLRYN